MTTERWKRLRDVLYGALTLAPEQRDSYLNAACGSDLSLRKEIEDLLSLDEESRSRQLAASAPTVTLAIGTRLGDYEVQSFLGAGGMGQVYRARDLRLRRDVAIKILPTSLSSDVDRLRRFEQEARAAATLNHPNILAIFQMGTYDGAPYLVSELLRGETVRELLGRGPLKAQAVISYGVQ